MGRGSQIVGHDILYGKPGPRSNQSIEIAPEPEIKERCRNWIEEKNNHCNEPAEFIVWGKLNPPEYLGPRCRNCAESQVGYDALKPDSGYAIYRLND